MRIITLFLMMFLHILADYPLQGILAQLKCKDFWKDYDIKYQDDYITALYIHSFMWSFMIMIPIIYNTYKSNDMTTELLCILFILINTLIHGIIDDMKANSKSITLTVDQATHFMQIIITFIVFSFIL